MTGYVTSIATILSLKFQSLTCQMDAVIFHHVHIVILRPTCSSIAHVLLEVTLKSTQIIPIVFGILKCDCHKYIHASASNLLEPA